MARTSTITRKGVSLAKGPIAILGIAGIVYGVLALIFGGNGFALHIPHGSVGGAHFIGLLTNGWTDLLFIAAGLLLTISAPGHWAAKSSAMLVALVLGAAAVIAVIRGNGVFGIFAANHWTEAIWGAAAIVLAVLAMMPRVGRRRETISTVRSDAPPVQDEPVVSERTSDDRQQTSVL
jgi:hypothetical protein